METSSDTTEVVERLGTYIRMEKIINTADVVVARDLASAELENLAGNRKAIQVLSKKPLFFNFLKFCFEMFFDDQERLEVCVDLFLILETPPNKLRELGFCEILDRLESITKYEGLVKNLKKTFHGFKRKKTTKRVSFLEERNELKYYVKMDSSLRFRHGGYREKDRSEALILKNKNSVSVPEKAVWHTPVKLGISKHFKSCSIYRAKAEERERASFAIKNVNPNIKFFPTDLKCDVRSDNKTETLPFSNYGIRNELPYTDILPRNKPAKVLRSRVSGILKNPKTIHDL